MFAEITSANIFVRKYLHLAKHMCYHSNKQEGNGSTSTYIRGEVTA